jgi:hypothetical protein
VDSAESNPKPGPAPAPAKPQPRRAENSPELHAGIAHKISELRAQLGLRLGADLAAMLKRRKYDPEHITDADVLKALEAEHMERDLTGTPGDLPPGAATCPSCDSTDIDASAADERDYHCRACHTEFRKKGS